MKMKGKGGTHEQKQLLIMELLDRLQQGGHLVVKRKMRLRIPSTTIVMFGSVSAATTFLEAVMTMEASAKTFLV